MTSRRAIPFGLAAFAYALALVQRPGQAAADTKVDLHVDPGAFLADVASVWSSSGGLGQVQAGQYAGYLFPMGPFYAAGSALGLEPWLVQRLWLGTLLALAAWGAVRLLDELLDRHRGVAHVTAGVLIVLNPYVTLFANRTSITLLGYVALPWLLLCVHRGVRDPRGWLWPAAIALVIASTGGGVNAAVTAWILLGPLLLLGYEVFTGTVRWRPLASFVARTALLCVLASLWWIVPVAEHARYGLNFLPFTESVGAIWETTSLTEALRGMGYWISYLGTGFGDPLHPYFDTSGTLLFDLPVVLASLLVPALAIGGFLLTRRLRYAPFLLALALLGTLVVMAGFPDGTPLRRGLTFAYNQLEPIQFLRTSHKAAPLVVVAIALLGGMLAGDAWTRLSGRRALRLCVPGLALGLAALSAWPLASGRGIGERIAYGDVPAAWTGTAADIERELPAAARTLVLPGQLFPSYRWGDTQDPILPALTERPVTVRTTVPYADLHAADLLYTTDALVQQRRVLPGQLRPLVELLGARAVVTGTDDDRSRSGALAPALASEQLVTGGLGQPVAQRGPRRRFQAPGGELGAGVTLPQVRRYDLPAARPPVRVQPRAPGLLVDGSAAGLAGLAAFGALPAGTAISYAGDRGAAELRRSAAEGAELVVTDSNRRRTFLSSRTQRTASATLGPNDPVAPEAVVLNPFPDRGTAGQTVAVYDGGVRAIHAPFSPGFPQIPEHRPYAAFDGSGATHWRADRNLGVDQHWIEIELDEPRDVPWIEILPRRERGVSVEAVEVGDRSFPVREGWNRLQVELGSTSSLRIEIAGVSGPIDRAAGALAEVRIPGLDVRELKRPPTLLTSALRGADLRRSALTYLFARELGDGPELHRAFDMPAPRRFAVDALVSLAPGARDPAINRCSIAVEVAGQVLRLRPHGTAAALEAGEPLRARLCGSGRAELPPGPLRLDSSSGPFQIDLLRLRSEAPAGLPPERGGGVVLDPGSAGRGRHDGVRLATGGPSWLVLGESYNRGWRAWCDGRELAEPEVIDGYANGWRIDGRCARARFAFAANGPAQVSYWAGGIACLGMLAALVVGWRRRAAGSNPGESRAPLLPAGAIGAADRPPRLTGRRALAIGVLAAAALGFVFALRVGLIAGPALAVVLWRGIGARALTLVGAGLLGIAVPAIYVVFLPADRGGFNSDYTEGLLGAHWVGVAGWLLLAAALLTTLAPLRASGGERPARRSRARPAPPASRPPPRESG